MVKVVALASILCFSAAAAAITVHDNGPWITGYGNGAGGANTSEVETGYGILGFITDIGASSQYMIADDFTVPSGASWDLSTLTWYAWETNSGTTSTITGAYVVIYDGAPGSGGNVLYGDETTNRLTSSTWSSVYRVTSSNLTNTQRPVMANMIDLSFVPDLSPATYWVAVGLTGSASFTGPWSNPAVPHRGSDNAVQRVSGGWFQMDGDPDVPGIQQQDVPFVLEGTVVPEASSLVLFGIGLVVVGLMLRRRRHQG